MVGCGYVWVTHALHLLLESDTEPRDSRHGRHRGDGATFVARALRTPYDASATMHLHMMMTEGEAS